MKAQRLYIIGDAGMDDGGETQEVCVGLYEKGLTKSGQVSLFYGSNTVPLRQAAGQNTAGPHDCEVGVYSVFTACSGFPHI